MISPIPHWTSTRSWNRKSTTIKHGHVSILPCEIPSVSIHWVTLKPPCNGPQPSLTPRLFAHWRCRYQFGAAHRGWKWKRQLPRRRRRWLVVNWFQLDSGLLLRSEVDLSWEDNRMKVWGCFLGFIWFIWLYWLWTLKHVWFKWTEPRNIRVNWCISLGAHAAGRKVNRRCLEWRNVHWIPFFCWRNQRPMNLHGHNMVYVSLLESHLIWSQWLLVYWYSEYFRVRFKAGKTLWASLCVDLLCSFFCVFGQCVSISNSYEYGKLFIPMP